MSLNRYKLGSVNNQVSKMMDSGWWCSTMEPFFGKIEDYGDFTLNKSGAAQFIVSRDRIQSLPVEFYKNMYEWLVVNTKTTMNVGFDPISKNRLTTKDNNDINSDYYTSRYMEWAWELIFTTVKNDEILSINVMPDIKIAAIYGGKKYFIDVTKHLISNFVKNNKIVIPKEISFNHVFGDVLCNTAKTLFIFIDNIKYELLETRNSDVMLDF